MSVCFTGDAAADDEDADDSADGEMPDAESDPIGPTALILAPTRELAIQVKNHIVAVAKYTGVKASGQQLVYVYWLLANDWPCFAVTDRSVSDW